MSPRVSIRLLPSQSDGRLVELAGRGQEHAFETLVRRYRRPLLRYCRRLGLSEARAEDVLQHSLTKAWLALSEGSEVREVRPWLYRIVHNDAVNAVRRAPVEHVQLTDATACSESSERHLEGHLEARDALASVASLPQMQRNAMVLTAIEGRSHDEAAHALGITDGAVRGLLHRARTTLRSAAAALLPPGMLRWPGRSGGLGLGERASELSMGGGAIGAGGVLLKGAAVTASVGLLAFGAGVERSAHHPSTAHATTRHTAKATGGSLSRPRSAVLQAVAGGFTVTRVSGRSRGHGGGERRHGRRRGAAGLSGGGSRSSALDRSTGDSRPGEHSQSSGSGSGAHDLSTGRDGGRGSGQDGMGQDRPSTDAPRRSGEGESSQQGSVAENAPSAGQDGAEGRSGSGVDGGADNPQAGLGASGPAPGGQVSGRSGSSDGSAEASVPGGPGD